MNIIQRFIKETLLDPAISVHTDDLKKENKILREKLEEKRFDLLSEVNSVFGYTNNKLTNEELVSSLFSWAYTNIDAIAEKIAEINFKLYSYKGNKVTEITEHEILEVLNHVNSFTTKGDHIYIWAFNMLTYGEAYWYLNKAGGKPVEMWNLQPRYMRPVPGDLRKNVFIKEYVYEIPGKPKQTFKPEEIIFFRKPNPFSTYRGYGVLEAAMNDIVIDDEYGKFSVNTLKNGARFDGVLKTDNKLSDDVYNRLQRKWEQRYTGSRNAGKTPILEQGLDYQTVQQTNKDLELIKQFEWTRDKIIAMFRNTKTNLGITDDVNRANAEASEASWVKHTIKPKMERLVEYLNEFLVPFYGDNLFLSYDDPSPDDMETKLQMVNTGVNNWLTINEAREIMGFDSIKGGDELKTVETDTEKPNENNENQNSDDDENNNEERQQREALKKFAKQISIIKNKDLYARKLLNKAIQRNLAKPYVVSKNNKTFTYEDKSAIWKQFANVTEAFEKQISAAVVAVVSKHEKEVMNNFNSEYSKGAKYLTHKANILPKESVYVTLSLDVLRPIFEKLAEQQGEDVFTFLGLDKPFTLEDNIKLGLEKIILKSSKSYIGTLGQRIKAIISNGIKDGESVDAIARKIRKKYAGFSKNESQVIARTEAIRSANYVNELAYIQSNVVVAKEWFTSLDDKVCPYCEPLEGKQFELGQIIFDKDSSYTGNSDKPITFGYESVKHPPLHPNCRCTLVPVIDKKSVKIEQASIKHEQHIDDQKNNSESLDIEVEKRVSEILEKTIEDIKQNG